MADRPSRPAPASDREARLAEALRANLRRRKAALKGRNDDQPAPGLGKKRPADDA